MKTITLPIEQVSSLSWTKELGARIRKFRTDADMPLCEMVSRSNLSSTHIHRIETGSVKSVPLKTIEKILSVLHVDLSKLFKKS